MQYLKQLPTGNRVYSSKEEYQAALFLDNVMHIIRTDSITIWREGRPGQVPPNMPANEPRYNYARPAQRVGHV